MSGHGDGHGHQHEEDHSVCVKVGVFFIAVIAMIFFLGMIKSGGGAEPYHPHQKTDCLKVLIQLSWVRTLWDCR